MEAMDRKYLVFQILGYLPNPLSQQGTELSAFTSSSITMNPRHRVPVLGKHILCYL